MVVSVSRLWGKKDPEEDLLGKVTLHSTRLDNDVARLLSHKMMGKYK